MNIYKLRAYTSKATGEAGERQLNEDSGTGNWQLARDLAQELADTYGAACLHNTVSGERYWFQRSEAEPC